MAIYPPPPDFWKYIACWKEVYELQYLFRGEGGLLTTVNFLQGHVGGYDGMHQPTDHDAMWREDALVGYNITKALFFATSSLRTLLNVKDK